MKRPFVTDHRIKSFDLAISHLPMSPNIVEIGTTRLKASADGASTVLFAYVHAEKGGSFTTVDIDPNNAIVSKEMIKEHDIPMNNIIMLTMDGMKFAEQYEDSIDLLYLDAWDYHGTESSTNHMDCFMHFYMRGCLKSGAMILIDDVLDNVTYRGKGETLIPYMINDLKCKVLINSYQVLLQMP